MWLKIASSRFAVFLYGAVLVAVLAVVGGEWGDWRRAERGPERAVEAKPTKKAERWERLPVERTIAQPVIGKKEKARIEKKYNKVVADTTVPTLETPLEPVVIAEVEDKREMPEGVDTLVTINPDGTPTVTNVPRPVAFVGFPRKWILYGEGLWDGAELDVVRAGVEFKALRVAKLNLVPKVEGFHERLPDEVWDDGFRFGVRVTYEP